MSLDLLHAASGRLTAGAGPLGLLSSDEFLPPVDEFDRRLLELSGPRVGVIYCADHRAQPHSERYAQKHFTALGARVPTTWTEGVGPIAEFAVAVHASSRSKEWLAQIARTSPVPVIALADKAGVILRNGRAPEVYGDVRTL